MCLELDSISLQQIMSTTSITSVSHQDSQQAWLSSALSILKKKKKTYVAHFLLQYDKYTSKKTTYLASDLVTVYSNHKMLGMRLVSRTRKYSEIGLSFKRKEERQST